MSKAAEHVEHDEDVPLPNWWKILDILVWVAVGVIAVIGAEWLIGYLVRERITQGANRYLATVNADTSEPPAT